MVPYLIKIKHLLLYSLWYIMRSISAIAILALAMPSTTLGFQISPASSRVLSTSLYSKPINNINEAIDRRSAIHQIGTAAAGVSLSSLLLSSDAALAAQDYDDEKKKRILITGSNSGIGLDAAQRIALRGHEVILACVSFSFSISELLDRFVMRSYRDCS